jgi:tellurite resistance protein
MEAILGLIGAAILWALLRVVINAFGAGARAAVRTVQGKGSFGANFDASFSGMQPMVTRMRPEQVDGDHPFLVQRIEAKGLFPITQAMKLAFSASVLDITEYASNGKRTMKPVMCFSERFQEPDTPCFGDKVEVGEVNPEYGWPDWQPVLSIIPEALVTPRSGRRNFRLFVLAFNSQAAPTIRNGFVVEGDPLAVWTHDFEWTVTNEGYEERSEKQERAEEGIIRVAVAVAFSDGAMHDTEGMTIRSWMSQRLDMLDEDDRASRRERFNAVMQEAYAAGKAGRLELGRTVEELKAVASPAVRTQAVELCLDVMSADGLAGDDELKVVNVVAQRLEVDLARFEVLKDKRLVGLAAGIRNDVDYHALLNIDPSWNRDQVRTHLNRLYAQWNSRAEALGSAEQRSQAEKMLEVIARAREVLVQ